VLRETAVNLELCRLVVCLFELRDEYMQILQFKATACQTVLHSILAACSFRNLQSCEKDINPAVMLKR